MCTQGDFTKSGYLADKSRGESMADSKPCVTTSQVCQALINFTFPCDVIQNYLLMHCLKYCHWQLGGQKEEDVLFGNQAEAMLMDLEFMKQPPAAPVTKLENKETKVVFFKIHMINVVKHLYCSCIILCMYLSVLFCLQSYSPFMYFRLQKYHSQNISTRLVRTSWIASFLTWTNLFIDEEDTLNSLAASHQLKSTHRYDMSEFQNWYECAANRCTIWKS